MFNNRFVDSTLSKTIKHIVKINPTSNSPIETIPKTSRTKGMFNKIMNRIISHKTTNKRNLCGFTLSRLYLNERQFKANTSSKNTKTKNNLV